MLISSDTTGTTPERAPHHDLTSVTDAGLATPPAVETSVLDGLAAVADRAPASLALVDEHGETTHGELDRTARALGLLLHERLTPDDRTGRGVGTEPGGAPVPVGTMVGHGSASVIALLGLLHAGRVVVALDPFLPEARLQHVMALAGIVDVVADAEHADRAAALVPEHGRLLSFDDLVAEARTAATSGADIAVVPGARDRGGLDPMVVIFTSGSTGAPKGVTMTHRQIVVDTVAQRESFRLVPADRVASVLPHGFAAGFTLVLSALLAGSSVHVADPRRTGVDRLVSWVHDARLTTLHTTPHLVRSMTGALDRSDDRLRALRIVATVGEAVTGADIAGLRPLLGPDTSFCNWTGSSETAVYAVNEIRATDPVPERSVPSGRIVTGKRIEVRRPDGSLADVGESGEVVCISDAMTSGYWGAPDVTATRAGTASDGTPTWAIGDLGRFDEQGMLTLLGRADDAVKVRGYLVEPSEVEAALRTVDAVQETVVVAVKAPPAPTRLVAYVVSRPGRRSPSPAAIRKALRDLLPDYMVPTSIVPVTALPRNERGKVDRSQLPEAPALGTTVGEDGAEIGEETYDQWQLAVGQIWAEVLGLPTVGPLELPAVGLDNDFAALGGDSLSAEEMLAAVADRLGVDLPSAELLEHPTLRTFTARIRRGAAATPSHPDIVTLAERNGNDAEPLFCIAGAGALALTYVPLARHLGDRPVHAFQQHGLERRSVPDWSVRAMARRYIELVRVVQPRGPYTLVGHSFGGLVALEMAAILTEAGHEVRRVVLLDTYLPEQAAEQADVVEFGELDLGRPAPRTVPGALRRIADRTAALRSRVVAPFGQLGRHARAYGAGVFRWDGQRQFRAFFDHALVVSRGYEPRTYRGAVTLVVADGNESGAARWARFLRGDVDEVRVHAEHSSLLREPHVAQVATLLAERLASA
ncbi:non-ribosomal peptide synthetase [Curtobacterium caseinilyticum]|uniref:Non-ribosomal peptide synthetase n=1 Tax=Curtobacterium caseinilyticum TaxID=3055137 RepID=A0ABT7TSQ6_9MICO|nr:non-ribosomal peptide synthetase [Curtobacterium caseinilyticum]MDM7892545.1 non-ribosomal peptide synthetase [Curtobacterium caseinilyticum]